MGARFMSGRRRAIGRARPIRPFSSDNMRATHERRIVRRVILPPTPAAVGHNTVME